MYCLQTVLITVGLGVTVKFNASKQSFVFCPSRANASRLEQILQYKWAWSNNKELHGKLLRQIVHICVLQPCRNFFIYMWNENFELTNYNPFTGIVKDQIAKQDHLESSVCP